MSNGNQHRNQDVNQTVYQFIHQFIHQFENQISISSFQQTHLQYVRAWLLAYFKQHRDALDTIEGYQETWKKCTQMYQKSLCTVGENVGILAAQSIGERQTQLTLNTFHHTGATSVTVSQGVPRFTELLNGSRTTKYTQFKCTTIPLSKIQVRVLTQRLVAQSLKDVVTFIDQKPFYEFDRPSWVESYLQSCDIAASAFLDSTCYYVRFDKSFLYRTHFSLYDFATRWTLFEHIDYIMYSPIHFGECFIWTPLSIRALLQYPISGMDTVIDVAYRPKDETELAQKKEWEVCIIAENGKKKTPLFISLLLIPWLTASVLKSNNMWDIVETLGIEATRCFLCEEFKEIIGTMLHYSHICLLVDMMLYSGKIHPISRYGVQKTYIGALSRASFEETMDNFLDAAWLQECDRLNGVSSSIVCGKPARIGTNLVDLFYNNRLDPS